jgi:hypothetical protein
MDIEIDGSGHTFHLYWCTFGHFGLPPPRIGDRVTGGSRMAGGGHGFGSGAGGLSKYCKVT